MAEQPNLRVTSMLEEDNAVRTIEGMSTDLFTVIAADGLYKRDVFRTWRAQRCWQVVIC